MNTQTQQITKQLNSLICSKLGEDWKSSGRYTDIDSAANAAGTDASDLLRQCRKSMDYTKNVQLERLDREKYVNDRIQTKEKDTPVADNGKVGRYVMSERRDAPGAEDSSLEIRDEEEEGPAAKALDGRLEDSLFHPERSVAWTDEPYTWNPTAPRSYGTLQKF